MDKSTKGQFEKCLIFLIINFYISNITATECGVEGDPRGTPRSMNDEAAPNLHLFVSMVFNVESYVNKIEYFAERSGLTYVSVWEQMSEEIYQLKGKIPINMQPGYNIYEVPSDSYINVNPGYVVGLHYPENATDSILSLETRRHLPSSGILSTSTFHDKLTRNTLDDGWQPGLNVTFRRQSRRAIPLTVHTAHCAVTEPPNRPNRPTPPPASSSDKSSKKSEDEKAQENEAVAIGVTIPLVAVAIAAAAIVFFLYKKRYICHNTNKVQVYQQSECTSTIAAEEEVDQAGDFYALYMQYMQYGMDGEDGQMQDSCYEHVHDAQVHLSLGDETKQDGNEYTILPPDRTNQSKTMDDHPYLTLPAIKEAQEEETYDSGLDIPNTESVCDSVSFRSGLNTDYDTSRSDSSECVRPKIRSATKTKCATKDSKSDQKSISNQKTDPTTDENSTHIDIESETVTPEVVVEKAEYDNDNDAKNDSSESGGEEESVLIQATVRGTMFIESDGEDDEEVGSPGGAGNQDEYAV